MVLHDAYHIYTVDRAFAALDQRDRTVESWRLHRSLPLLTQLAREAEKIELLYLGLMFHDIGKGFGGGHSEIGARMVHSIARRMRLNADDGALVEFLVRHHLLMTHTAFRRDLEDEKTIFDFAKTMGSVNNLKMLYLLTFADVKAVGPRSGIPGRRRCWASFTSRRSISWKKPKRANSSARIFARRCAVIQTRVRRELSKDTTRRESKSLLRRCPSAIFSRLPKSDIAEPFRVDG